MRVMQIIVAIISFYVSYKMVASGYGADMENWDNMASCLFAFFIFFICITFQIIYRIFAKKNDKGKNK